METKACKHCKETKPLAMFGNQSRNKDGKSGKCRACLVKYTTWWQQEKLKRLRAKYAHVKGIR